MVIAAELIGDWSLLILLPFLLVFLFLTMVLFSHAPAILVRGDLRVSESMKRIFRLFFSSSLGSICLSTLLAGVAALLVNMVFLIVAGLIIGFCILLQFLVHEGFVVLTIVAGIPLGLAYAVIVLPLSIAVADTCSFCIDMSGFAPKVCRKRLESGGFSQSEDVIGR